MRIVCIVSLFIFDAIACSSQSFIGAAVGVDYAKIEQTEATQPFKDDGFVVTEEGYSVRSAFYGIQGEKYLSNKVSIAINLIYTEKEMGANNGFFIPIEGIKFNSYSGMVSGKWYPTHYFFISTGVSFSYLSNFRSYIHTGTEYQIELENKKKYGHLLSFGFRYKNFLIGPYFINGLNIGSKTDHVDLKPIDSYGFSLTYLLRISEGKDR